MSRITIGSVIEKARIEKKTISRKMLVQGICSEQMLYDIEKDRRESDPLLVDILLQRLGKSPDKLERVLQVEMYRMVRIRDLLEQAILRGRRVYAEKILEQYPMRTNVDKMYQRRMQACLLYRMDQNLEGAKTCLREAIDLTLPHFSYEEIARYRISTVEMENLLGVERMLVESRSNEDIIDVKRHLEILADYIDKNFTDEEEHAKVYSKCAWLLAFICFLQKDYLQTMVFCQKGMEGLRKNAILYFMFPLLSLMTDAQEAMGIDLEKSKWARYREILTFLWKSYAEEWYPTDCLFHNCSQQEYYLDYELARHEREAKGMTQEDLSQGVYQNVESYSRFETGRVSPKKRTFEKLMEKLGIEKGRYNGYAVTDSFETMELRRSLDRLIGCREYAQAEAACEQLKKELDMEMKENRQYIESEEILIQSRLGKIPFETAADRQKALLADMIDFSNHSLRRIPMRNDVLRLNYYCAALKETGQRNEAEWIYRCALQKMERSRVNIKYRSRSYSLLLNNYSAIVRTKQCIHGVLKNELRCGKISMLPFCLNNILHTMERDGRYEQEYIRWAEFVYYISDLLYQQEVKMAYGDYLENRCDRAVLH